MTDKQIITIHYKNGVPIVIELTDKKPYDSIDILKEIMEISYDK